MVPGAPCLERRPRRRRGRHRHPRRSPARARRQGGDLRHRSDEPRLRGLVELGRLHRRWHGDRLPRRSAAHGPRVRPVPPDRAAQRRAGHRRVPGRGRDPRQRRRRALHGALRAQQDGARQPRRGVARRGRGAGRGARRRRLHPARPAAHRWREDPHAALAGARAVHGHRRGRPLRRAHPRQTHAALLHGRHQGRRRRSLAAARELLRGRRVQLRLGARRQSPRRQLAARRPAVRAAGGRGGGGVGCGPRRRRVPARRPPRRADRDRQPPRAPGRRAPRRPAPRAPAAHAARRRHLPRAPRPAGGRRPDRRAQGALLPCNGRRQGPRVQHRPAADPRDRPPARHRRVHRPGGAQPRGEPRQPRRRDFPERDDRAWLRHSLFSHTADGPACEYAPVTITRFQPEERSY